VNMTDGVLKSTNITFRSTEAASISTYRIICKNCSGRTCLSCDMTSWTCSTTPMLCTEHLCAENSSRFLLGPSARIEIFSKSTTYQAVTAVRVSLSTVVQSSLLSMTQVFSCLCKEIYEMCFHQATNVLLQRTPFLSSCTLIILFKFNFLHRKNTMWVRNI
jgi:hypothetical protein